MQIMIFFRSKSGLILGLGVSFQASHFFTILYRSRGSISSYPLKIYIEICRSGCMLIGAGLDPFSWAFHPVCGYPSSGVLIKCHTFKYLSIRKCSQLIFSAKFRVPSDLRTSSIMDNHQRVWTPFKFKVLRFGAASSIIEISRIE